MTVASMTAGGMDCLNKDKISRLLREPLYAQKLAG